MISRNQVRYVIKPPVPIISPDVFALALQVVSKSLDEILSSQPLSTSRQMLRKLIQDLCAHNRYSDLLKSSTEKLENRIAQITASLKIALSNANDDDWIIMLDETWKTLFQQIDLISKIMVFFDSSTFMRETQHQSLLKFCNALIRKYIFSDFPIQKRIEKVVLNQLNKLRQMEMSFLEFSDTKHIVNSMESKRDSFLNQKYLADLHICSTFSLFKSVGLYSLIEKQIEQETIRFYKNWSKSYLSSHDLSCYLFACKYIFQLEDLHTLVYFAPTQRGVVLNALGEQSETIIDSGVSDLFRNNKREELVILYEFFSSIQKLPEIRKAFSTFIKAESSRIITVNQQNASCVPLLIDFHNLINGIIEHCFENKKDFHDASRDGLEFGLNTLPDVTPHLFAKYIDHELKSMGSKEAAVSSSEPPGMKAERIKSTLLLFRHLQSKDIFFSLYQWTLAHRLLGFNPIVKEDEYFVIDILQRECGKLYTQRLENMFADIESSKSLFQKFLQQRENSEDTMKFVCNVISKDNWPDYPLKQTVALPPQFSSLISAFSDFYLSETKTRQLVFCHQLSTVIVVVRFPKGVKELGLSLFQTICLLPFVSTEKVTYEKLAFTTQLGDQTLTSVLQTLLFSKNNPLLLESGNSISKKSTFIFNKDFTSPHRKIKLSNTKDIKLMSKSAKNIAYDRQLVTETKIVKIMKSFKELSHTELCAKVKSDVPFPITETEIKKQIELLIEREFLERDTIETQLYRYVV